MRTLFILGAGASRQGGGPLMSDFLDAADDILRQRAQLPKPTRDAFDEVFNAIAELQSVHAKAYLDTDNIESLFGAVEMGELLAKFAGRSPESVAKLRSSLVTLIVVTLERCLKFPVRSRSPTPPEPYERFANVLKEAPGHEFSFLTFNYDVALDFALRRGGVGLDYCLVDNDTRPSNPLLKLHGSINWGVCPSCEAVVPYDVGQLRFDLWDEEIKFVLLDVGSKLHNATHCGNHHLVGPPVLVPPTWNKSYQNDALRRVWRRAAMELSTAENIFVIGYSLPDTDQFFRYLFALGTEGKARLQRFWVFNPDEDGTVEPRYRRLIGRALERRYVFHRATFEQALDSIHGAIVRDTIR